jgi:type II secretory pathway component PulF
VSLGAIEKQLKNQYLKDVVREITSSVETGSSLSDAMEKHPKVFNELYVSMIRAGEAGGILDDILERLADLGEKELDTRNRIKSATRYPMIAFFVLCIAFTVVVTFVIPKFSSVFAQFKTDLPLPTRILLGLSSAFKKYWLIELAAIAGLFFWFRYVIRLERGKLIWDTVKLKVPVFGPILLMLIMSRLTRVMAILIRSGLPILQILDMVARTSDNAVIARAIGTITESVREGKGLTEPMRLTGIFPPIVLQMVSVGEETGKIDELLLSVSDYFDQQSDYQIKNLTVLIEPLFVVFLGIMVLIMALAIFLPMWNLSTLFRH